MPLFDDSKSLTTLQPPLRAAIRLSLTSGTFIDTKFYVFSRGGSSGSVHTPLPIYANSGILRAASPYLETLLASGFQEDRLVNIDDHFPPDRPSSAEDYGYESDSDLEDEGDVDGDSHMDLGQTDRLSTSQSKSADEFIVAGDEIAKQDIHSQVTIGQTSQTLTAKVTPHNANRIGRVIHIPDAAHRTWEALVFYLYTGETSFKALKSLHIVDNAKSEKPIPNGVSAFRVPPCSPKSMYRLADMMGLEELKTRSAFNIRAQLCPENCLTELFSRFTSWYPQILDIELVYSHSQARQIAVLDTLPKYSEDISKGLLPHCGGTLAALLRKLFEASASPAVQSGLFSSPSSTFVGGRKR